MLMKRPLAAPRGGGGAGAGVPADAAAGSSGQQQQNPMALQPDGSAVNPDLMLQLLRSSPQQLDQLPPPLADAVRAGDVNNMQVFPWLAVGGSPEGEGSGGLKLKLHMCVWQPKT